MSAEQRKRQLETLPEEQIQQIFIPLLKDVTDIHIPVRISSVEKIGQGQFSFGFKVLVETSGTTYPFFIKTERDRDEDESGLDIARRKDLIDSSRPRSGVNKSYGAFGLDQITVTRIDETDITPNQLKNLDLVFAIQNLLDPKEYKQMLTFLGQLGLSTIQSAELMNEMNTSKDDIVELYKEVTEKMLTLHESPLGPAILARSRELYKNGVLHVIEDSTRLNGLGALMPQFSEGRIGSDKVDMLKERMSELAQRYSKDARTRLSAIHGDLWSANIFVSTDKLQDRVEIIDPASVGFGEAGYDVVFAYADLAFLDANKSKGETLVGDFSQIADNFVTKYGLDRHDRHIRKYMALFYGYKAFVSSLFDANENQDQRYKLFTSALGAVELALADPDFEFSFNRLDAYSVAGAQVFNQE